MPRPMQFSQGRHRWNLGPMVVMLWNMKYSSPTLLSFLFGELVSLLLGFFSQLFQALG